MDFDRLKITYFILPDKAMSLTQRIQQGFLRLSLSRKVLLIGSAVLMLSPLMPWYDNRNGFGIGESLLGIQGPLFMAGFMVAVCGAIGFFNLFLPLMGKHFFDLRKKNGGLAMLLGFEALMVLVLANSVFFHPEFGTNVSHKTTRFGMIVAFVGLGLMIGAGYLLRRQEKSGQVEEIEDIMVNAEPEMTMERHHIPTSQWTTPRTHASVQTEIAQEANGVDPLTMDPKTRYKLMQARLKQQSSNESQSNLWGARSGASRIDH
jgi:hypothetical protein